jgi:hypothetical protein
LSLVHTVVLSAFLTLCFSGGDLSRLLILFPVFPTK